MVEDKGDPTVEGQGNLMVEDQGNSMVEGQGNLVAEGQLEGNLVVEHRPLLTLVAATLFCMTAVCVSCLAAYLVVHVASQYL